MATSLKKILSPAIPPCMSDWITPTSNRSASRPSFRSILSRSNIGMRVEFVTTENETFLGIIAGITTSTQKQYGGRGLLEVVFSTDDEFDPEFYTLRRILKWRFTDKMVPKSRLQSAIAYPNDNAIGPLMTIFFAHMRLAASDCMMNFGDRSAEVVTAMEVSSIRCYLNAENMLHWNVKIYLGIDRDHSATITEYNNPADRRIDIEFSDEYMPSVSCTTSGLQGAMRTVVNYMEIRYKNIDTVVRDMNQ